MKELWSSLFRQIKSNKVVLILILIISIALGVTLFNGYRVLANSDVKPGQRENQLIDNLEVQFTSVPIYVTSLEAEGRLARDKLIEIKEDVDSSWAELQGYSYILDELIDDTDETINELYRYIDDRLQGIPEEESQGIAKPIVPFIMMQAIREEVNAKAQGAINNDNIKNIIIAVLIIAICLFSVIAILWVDSARILKDLEAAREETNGILSTIQEGLFLIHEDRNVGSEYSRELESILGIKDIGGNNLTDLLGSIISESDMKNVNAFLNSLFNPKVVERLIANLNPLKEIAVSITNPDGSITDKYLSFNFFRVKAGNKIQDILTSVRDVTDSVTLKNQLEASKEENEQQLQLLVSLMNINPNTLKLFLEGSIASMKNINGILKAEVKNKNDFYQKIDKIFIHVHRIKGEASAIELNDFAEQAHVFEDELQSMRKINNMGGMDFLPLTVKLNHMISYADALTEMSERLSQSYSGGDTSVTPKNAANKLSDWEHLHKLVKDLTREYGKKAQFITNGLSEVSLPDHYKKVLNGVLVHLIKNCLVHGIEKPEQRLKAAKPEEGRIDLRLSQLNNGFIEVVFKDDGRGFDYQGIAKKLVEDQLVDQETIKSWTNNDIIKYLFNNKVSTAEVDMNAGRGLGLNVILSSIRELGGKVHLNQSLNKYCQFSITLPPAV